MHWVSPADEPAHNDVLRVLSKGGFDKALQSIGQHFGFDGGLSVYHVAFTGVSHCTERSNKRLDLHNVDGKAFQIVVPLNVWPGAMPELELFLGDDDYDGDGVSYGYKFRQDTAIMIGDNVLQATAGCSGDTMQLAMSIFVADINKDNIRQLAGGLTQAYVDSQVLLFCSRSHIHLEGNLT